MVQTLEAIRGGGESVKVGTTGKISALMSKEIESTKGPSTEISSRKLKARTLIDEASSSAASNKCPENVRKTKHRSHHIPMLAADNMWVDGTPIRQKPNRIVEIVDIKCGNPEKTWTNPITNRLKKLGFSKLSESMG